ncbi:hypothetical protein M1K46_14890 [Fictibacillus sp. WQ 8-8]|uniref:hypothetical protein n=1 Tax=Fictibacillus sp. WQ 8-8 TaxID=2938788 RepID=UPI00210C430D|nr:hypothetical protein [Fictibacillus sp. WQ 8-8]MCQ6266940.1 hypothetical protein [Fictibacillus sp. WQ 8-8]
MKKKYQNKLIAIVVMTMAAIYFFISLNPPLSVVGGHKKSANETWIEVKNEGWLSLKVDALYVNNNVVPAEASFLATDKFKPLKKQTIHSGEEKYIRIFYEVPLKRITVAYSFGGISFIRSFSIF